MDYIYIYGLRATYHNKPKTYFLRGRETHRTHIYIYGRYTSNVPKNGH